MTQQAATDIETAEKNERTPEDNSVRPTRISGAVGVAKGGQGQVGESEETAVSDHFHLELARSFECVHCGHCWHLARPEFLTGLSLDLPELPVGGTAAAASQVQISISELLKSYFATSEVTLTCDKCKTPDGRAKSACRVRKLPSALMLHLKRFTIDPSTMRPLKRNDAVRLDVNVDISDCCAADFILPTVAPGASPSKFNPTMAKQNVAYGEEEVDIGGGVGGGAHAARKVLFGGGTISDSPQAAGLDGAGIAVLPPGTQGGSKLKAVEQALSEAPRSGFRPLATIPVSQPRSERAPGGAREDQLLLRTIEASQMSFAIEQTRLAALTKAPRAEAAEQIDLCDSDDDAPLKHGGGCLRPDGYKNGGGAIREEKEDDLMLFDNQPLRAGAIDAPAFDLTGDKENTAHTADASAGLAPGLSAPPGVIVGPIGSIGSPELPSGLPSRSTGLTPGLLSGFTGLPSGVSPLGSAIYRLEAVVQHCGSSAQFGHYIAATRDATTQRWTLHDDEKVTRGGGDDILIDKRMLRQAYMVILTLVRPQQSPPSPAREPVVSIDLS